MEVILRGDAGAQLSLLLLNPSGLQPGVGPVRSEICVSLFALRTLYATGPSRITLSLRLIEYLESCLWARAGLKGG